ncbi:predicted protein [Micromonas commoda]|uniref:Uncharacterized protein n=1 Tax=Micromonas commoda (strain RCC299 / NOUM17 / CCMP2709) TaxID=296587 RepID=C1DZV6_MICCC|nr:predicted protein [Micromonas commoda]ACO61186.1 predicted protein [Micromonas commoda]|eukprot:XP_002499928.1 predicted protein [Micromonas commoda]
MISARDMSKSQSKSHSVTPASTVISFPLILYVRPDTTGTRSLAPATTPRTVTMRTEPPPAGRPNPSTRPSLMAKFLVTRVPPPLPVSRHARAEYHDPETSRHSAVSSVPMFKS